MGKGEIFVGDGRKAQNILKSLSRVTCGPNYIIVKRIHTKIQCFGGMTERVIYV